MQKYAKSLKLYIPIFKGKYYFIIMSDVVHFECQKCNKIFTTKGVLKRHIETSKKCSKATEEDMYDYNCEYCSYYTNNKHNFNKHILTTKHNNNKLKKQLEDQNKRDEEQKKIIQEYEKKIAVQEAQLELTKEYEKKLCDLSSSISNINKNTYVTYNTQYNYSMKNLSDYSEIKDNLEELIDKIYNETAFYRGSEGISSMLIKLLKPIDKTYYLCYDKTGVFHRYINAKIDKDHKATKLLEDILPIVDKKVKNIWTRLEYKFEKLRNAARQSVEHIDNEEKRDQVLNEKIDQIFNIQEQEMDKYYKAHRSVNRLKELGSSERSKCIKKLVEVLCIPTTLLKDNKLDYEPLDSNDNYQDKLLISEDD